MAFLSIIIPAFNEEARLPGTLDLIEQYIAGRPASWAEVLVVDDGSRDGTAALVERRRASWPGLILLRNPGNRGKGYSVRHGMLSASGEWRLFSDADLSTPIQEVEKMMAMVREAGADIAIGSRALDRTLVGVHQSAFREFSGRAFNLFMRAATGLPFQDTQCGFKLFRNTAAEHIFAAQQLDGFSFDVEDLVIAQVAGFRTIEVPVRWNNVAGTKVSAVQGLKSFTDVLRIRWKRLSGSYAAVSNKGDTVYR